MSQQSVPSEQDAAHAASRNTGEATGKENARIRQSEAPVDVPRTPGKPSPATEDVAAEESKPPKNPDDGPVWSDTELPAPNKKGVRQHWL